MSFLGRIAAGLNNWTSRWVPGAFSIALVLTLVTVVLAITMTGHSFFECLTSWGDGFWELLSFSMQMTLIMVTGYIVVVSPLVSRGLKWFAGLPRTATSAIVFTAFGSMALSWINWGLGLIGSAMLVRYVARKHTDIDYRLLVAVAYFGAGCTWHAGLSASAPILVATPKHFMEAQIGLIPLTRTIFHPFNLVATATVFVVMTVMAALMHPRDAKQRVTVDPHKLDRVGVFEAPVPDNAGVWSFADFLDYRYLLNLLIGLAGIGWLGQYLYTHGWQGISINTVNFTFLTAGVLLHPSPASVGKAAAESAAYIYNIILQFPFYSGMYGIIKGTGLSDRIGEMFVAVANPRTLPLIVYWYSGVVNYFVPSGGSKWAVEAPYVIAAAKTLGVGFDKIVLSYAWGDMMTDLLQPFWALPLLAAAGVEFKEILGYEMIACFVYVVVVSLFFYFLPFY